MPEQPSALTDIISYYAPPPLGPSGEIKGQWYSSAGIITKANTTSTFSLKLTLMGEAPSNVNVEVGYYYQGAYKHLTFPVTGDETLNITIGGENYDAMSKIYFRATSASLATQIDIASSIEMLPATAGNPNQNEYDYGGALDNLVIQQNGTTTDIPDGGLGNYINGPVRLQMPRIDIPEPDWLNGGGGLYGKVPNLYSPLVLDLDGDGVEVTKLGAGALGSDVYFDLNNDGFAERTAWITGGDGLLAWDKNGNGLIDNQGELFGNSATYSDGFAYLATLDSNADGKITSADVSWNNLKVWVDADQNGITDSGELKTLTQHSITQINVNAAALTDTYNNENVVSDTSTFVKGGVTRTISDVWFRADQTDTISLSPVSITTAVFNMPTLKGFGILKDLHAAMASNATLKTMVETFDTAWNTSRFGNKASLETDINNILFNWANVQNVGITSRGSYVNGRELAFLEKLYGYNYVDGWIPNQTNPGDAQGQVLSELFDHVSKNMGAALIAQSGLADTLYDLKPVYNADYGQMVGGVLLASAVSALSAKAASAPNANDYWVSVATYLTAIKNTADFTMSEKAALDAAIQVNLPSSSWTAILGQALDPLPEGLTILTTKFSDEIVGTSANESMQGLAGDDTYFFKRGDGQDAIYDSAGTDTIQLGEGLVESDIRFERLSTSLRIYIGATDRIEISSQFYDTQNGFSNDIDEVEFLRFSNGQVIDLKSTLTLTGTAAGETLNGTNIADILIGLGGNDMINGQLGNDRYKFSTGFGIDQITDTGGTDTIELGAGITQNDVRFYNYGSNILSIHVGTSDRIDISAQFQDIQNGTNDIDEIETPKFSDGSTINLKGVITFTGTSASETVNGTPAADVVKGLGGDDILYGRDGNDILDGGAGNDGLLGGAGADTFRYQSGTTFGSIDTIYDFVKAEGDKIGLSNILQLYDPLTQAITDFVQITQSGGNSILKVDADGGANGFIQIATLMGTSGLTDEAAQVSSGTLIVH